jgi:hypothetical protein
MPINFLLFDRFCVRSFEEGVPQPVGRSPLGPARTGLGSRGEVVVILITTVVAIWTVRNVNQFHECCN